MSRRWRSTRRARCGTRSARTGGTTGRRRAAAGGIHPLAFHLTGLDQDALEALVRLSRHARPRGAHRRRLGHARRQPLAAERLRAAVAGAARALPQLALEVGLAHARRAARVVGDRARAGRARPPGARWASSTSRPDSFSDGGRFAGARRGAGAGRRAARGGRGHPRRGRRIHPTRPRRSRCRRRRSCARVVPVVEALVRRASRAADLGGHGEGGGRPGGARRRRGDRERRVRRFGSIPAMAARSRRGRGGRGPDALAGPHPRDRLVRARRVRRRCRRRGDRRAAGGARRPRRRRASRPSAIVLDPGFGFSKTRGAESRALRSARRARRRSGRPVLVGPSRKRFLGAVTGLPRRERDRATARPARSRGSAGARLFRVHDVAAARDALAFAQAVGGP